MERLKALRDSIGYSQQKLAQAIGSTQQKIHAYETDSYQPDIDTLIIFADFFNTSVDYLIGHTSVRRAIDDVSPFELNTFEAELIERYRKLPPSLQKSAVSIIDLLVDGHK